MNSKWGIMKSYMAQRPDKHGACTVAVYYALSDEQCEKPSSYQVISLVLGPFNRPPQLCSNANANARLAFGATLASFSRG